jgi:hypothetical protein
VEVAKKVAGMGWSQRMEMGRHVMVGVMVVVVVAVA